ncbi:hypothetical protein BT63DRAFT_450964 [Microthyrium microscopicum]|uniref:Uncharacterized protein n=1 Tax=Microthyrium microscopicum TaxID=703497 RepID=A0A6A6UML6_9PEZI|nr:hypothetical protein BT63DRAFT_450964 [Microthyrium microscopicum]
MASEAPAVTYWNHQVHLRGPAIYLAAYRLRLQLPGEMKDPDFRSKLEYPLRRLIRCGLDTPDNFEILFGSDWKCVLRTHGRLRIGLLIKEASSAGSVGGFETHVRDENFLECRSRTMRPATQHELGIMDYLEQNPFNPPMCRLHQ